ATVRASAVLLSEVPGWPERTRFFTDPSAICTRPMAAPSPLATPGRHNQIAAVLECNPHAESAAPLVGDDVAAQEAFARAHRRLTLTAGRQTDGHFHLAASARILHFQHGRRSRLAAAAQLGPAMAVGDARRGAAGRLGRAAIARLLGHADRQ